MEDCVFCNTSSLQVLRKNAHAFAIKDKYPVSLNHSLVIPVRHVESFFELTVDEVNACMDLLRELGKEIRQNDSKVDGFNLGLNDGEVAGQTINHCHWHIIPRRRKDVEDPRGGIRRVVGGRGYYGACDISGPDVGIETWSK